MGYERAGIRIAAAALPLVLGVAACSGGDDLATDTDDDLDTDEEASAALADDADPIGSIESIWPGQPSPVRQDVMPLTRRGDLLELRLNMTNLGNEVAVSLAADVLFAFDSAELEGDATGRIAEMAEELATQATGTVEITGHTDDVGTRSYNQALSEDRAQAVADALAPAPEDTELTLDVSGRAFDEPLVDDDTEEARARNRRVEIRYERG